MSDIVPDEHRNYLQLHSTSVKSVLISIRLDKHSLTSMTFCFPISVPVIPRSSKLIHKCHFPEAQIIRLTDLFFIFEKSVIEVQSLYEAHLSDYY